MKWCASVRLNGVDLGSRFFGPFRWQAALKKGRNVLEVTVANLLVNALNERAHARIAQDYPPDSAYSSRQIEYDKSFQASGLFGPIVLRAAVR